MPCITQPVGQFNISDTSVPRKEARQACKEALEGRTTKTIPTDSVLEMIDMVLQEINFKFTDKQFLQKKGTAIGSKLGANYSGTYMVSWERELLDTSDDQPLVFYRFRDDIIGLWEHGLEKLKKFHNIANKIHPDIQVDLRYSNQEIEFLDTKVQIKGGLLTTNLYVKPTDRQLYLHSDSTHPLSTKKSIPYGLALRIKRICTNESDYMEQREKLKDQPISRGYSHKIVHKQFRKVDNMSREEALQYKGRKQQSQKKRTPLVVTYNEKLPNIGKILHSRQRILKRSPRLSEIFHQQPMVAFRRAKNLADVLVHHKHNKTFNTSTPGSAKCGKNCRICKVMIETNTFTNGEDIFKINSQINCKTNNVVYGIFCQKCDKIVYVGETETTLYERMQNHLSAIRNYRDDDVPRHFNSKDHSIDYFNVVGIERTKIQSTDYLLRREALWIKKLKTQAPAGLNKK